MSFCASHMSPCFPAATLVDPTDELRARAKRHSTHGSQSHDKSLFGVEECGRKGGQDVRRRCQVTVSTFSRAYPSWIKGEFPMKTIHPIGLAGLIARHQLLDLIDVRTKREFDKTHIPGARSIPLPELSAAKILHNRSLPATEPVYVICRSRVLANLASGILERAGFLDTVVVDGGMETWEAQRLPVVRRNWFPKITFDVPMLVLMAGFGLGLAIDDVFFLVPLLIGFVALVLKIRSFARRQTRQGHAVDLPRPSPVENWAVPHLSRFVSHPGREELFFHPSHRGRFARSHSGYL